MPKLKLLHIIHSFDVGGLENGLVNLINHLDPERYAHEVCCIATSGPMASRLERPVIIHELGKGASDKSYQLPLKLAGLIRSSVPDIVHTRNWGTIDGITGARLAGVKKIVHGEHGREASDPHGKNRKRKIIRKLISPAISRFVPVSADLNDWLINDIKVPAKKVYLIINGVDMSKFEPAVDKHALRRRLGLAEDCPLIGIVGRLDPVKDHATLIKAFAKVSGLAQLIIVGDGPMRQSLQSIVGELKLTDRTVFLGTRNDVADILGALDVFVLPSIAEGISNTILEAMSSGLPVVASRVGGNPELVADNTTGVLFEPGDHEHLTRILSNYITNQGLTRQHGQAGRKRVEDEFSLEIMVQKYDELYSSLMI